jgi:hypothetical protein
MIWIVLQIPAALTHFYNLIFDKPDFYNGNLGMFISAFIGLLARFFAVILAFIVGFVVWADLRVKWHVTQLVETALFLEGTYFLLLFPSGLWWLGVGLNFFGLAYLLEAACAGSTLLLLSFKVRDFGKNKDALKWLGIGIVGYVLALWFNSVFRWLDQIAVIGSSFLLRGATSWGFLVSLSAMSLAVIFAIWGAHFLAKNHGEALSWLGLSMAMIGVYYAVYAAYSYTSGNLESAMQIDVWTIPFVFLGIALMRSKVDKELIRL